MTQQQQQQDHQQPPPIDYRRPDTPSRATIGAFGVPTPDLVVGSLVVLAPIALCLSWIHWFSEPFGVVKVVDLVVFGGAVAVSAGGCLVVPLLARRTKIPLLGTMLIVGWLATCAYAAIKLFLPYFDEPWNY